jgi:hypothetical protein
LIWILQVTAKAHQRGRIFLALGSLELFNFTTLPSTCGQGTASSFYRPRGGGLQSCRRALSATYGGMAHSVVELMVVLANLASGRRRGESCARPAAASRVVVWELLVWLPFVRRFEGSTDGRPRPHSSQRDDVPSIWVPTMSRMTLQRSGWRHSDGDGRTGPEVAEGTRFAGLTSRRRLGRVPGRWSYPFRGFRRPLSRERHGGGTGVGGTASWNDTSLPAQLPHSAGDGRTSRVGGTAPGYDSQAVLEGRRGGDSPLTWAPAMYRGI